MDMRKVAESLPAELDTAAHWIEAWCPFENAIPHAERLRKRSEEIRSALAQPDMLAEAVELLRQAEIMLSCYEYHPLPRQIAEFTTRYDAAQRE